MGCNIFKYPLNLCKDKSDILEDYIISENITNIHRSNFSIAGNNISLQNKCTKTPPKYFLQLTDLKDTNETDIMKEVIVPQPQSDRSNISKKTCLTETNDRVDNIPYSRLGKSFLALLKEFNFVHKLYHKGENTNQEKMSMSSPQNESDSFCCSKCTSNNSKAMSIASVGSFTFKESGMCREMSQKSVVQKKVSCDNFNKFKILFYVPVISLTGIIENTLEVSNKNDMVKVVSFSMQFEYFEHFFTYYFNLLHNLKITSEIISSFQSNLSPLFKFLQVMKVIKLSYGIRKYISTISLTFFTMPKGFYDSLFPYGLPNSLQALLVSSNWEKRSLTIHVVTSGEVEYEIHFTQAISTLRESLSLANYFEEVMGEQREIMVQIGKELDLGYANTSFTVGFVWREGKFNYRSVTIVRHGCEERSQGQCSELNWIDSKYIHCSRQKAHFSTSDLETEIIYEYSFN